MPPWSLIGTLEEVVENREAKDRGKEIEARGMKLISPMD
jgi:hypothetical protein